MGNNHSKDPELEFVATQAYKCGMTEEKLVEKEEIYAKYAKEDKILSKEEFGELFKELSHDVFEDDYLDQYVEGLFRAFDTNGDGSLSFREWRVGYFLLLLLDREGGNNKTVTKEEWTSGMELIYRLYDVDGNNLLTGEEVNKISDMFNQPCVIGRLYGDLIKRFTDQVEEVQLIEKCAGGEGLTKEQFLEQFTVKIPTLLPGQTPKPLDLDEDGDGEPDNCVSSLTRIEYGPPEPIQ